MSSQGSLVQQYIIGKESVEEQTEQKYQETWLFPACSITLS